MALVELAGTTNFKISDVLYLGKVDPLWWDSSEKKIGQSLTSECCSWGPHYHWQDPQTGNICFPQGRSYVQAEDTEEAHFWVSLPSVSSIPSDLPTKSIIFKRREGHWLGARGYLWHKEKIVWSERAHC